MSDRDQLAHWRDQAHATRVVVDIDLAAEANPEEMRRALGRCFDLGLVEAQMAKAMENLRLAELRVNEVWNIALDLERRVAEMADRLLARDLEAQLAQDS